MKSIKLPMGCLSSRSSVTPSDSAGAVESGGRTAKSNGLATNSGAPSGANNLKDNEQLASRRQQMNVIDKGGGAGESNSNSKYANNGARSLKKKAINRGSSLNSSVETADDDIMSLLMEDKNGHKSKHRKSGPDNLSGEQQTPVGKSSDNNDGRRRNSNMNNNNKELNGDEDEEEESIGEEVDDEGNTSMASKKNEGSFNDEAPNMELLRQYVAVDYEITQLEDKDALRVYHEKIEQLEQLERELDMISSEAAEVAGRSGDGTDMSRAPSVTGALDSKVDIESNSAASGVSENTSWKAANNNGSQTNLKTTANDKSGKLVSGGTGSQPAPRSRGDRSGYGGSQQGGEGASVNRMSYSTVEEVFNKKIILEKERDKLKKEVEIVILECDKLQQRYKKRDEILDKLFDGRTGNGLENHLEQQLNWLLEQKHYVDQVFFAWKRAETLTSQTCEQFASALELLKRLPKVEQSKERAELAKDIERLLLKSRQDMEQAQKYNPNVDAPFFTDNETERFDKIIKTIQSEQINPSDYSQILTVIQFAYKRAVSIRLWLEQILHTTIARDSFELAEEYKWIAIQLRKERINLIKSKLQDSPYREMARAVHDQMARRRSISGRTKSQQHEVNRDSGIESEPNDLDIEEEIYRVLEMNKSRLESLTTANSNANSALQLGKNSGSAGPIHRLHPNQMEPGGSLASSMISSAGHDGGGGGESAKTEPASRINGDSGRSPTKLRAASPTPTKLKVELDEEARRSLLSKYN